MNSTIAIIIVVISLAARALAAIDKAKKDRTRKEEAERRRLAAESSSSSSIAPSTNVSQPRPLGADPGSVGRGAPVGSYGQVRTGRPVDDIAARRKQQLDELRQRRAGGGGLPSAPPRPSAAPSPRTGLGRGPATPFAPPSVPSDAARMYQREGDLRKLEGDRAAHERDIKSALRRAEQRRQETAQKVVAKPASMEQAEEVASSVVGAGAAVSVERAGATAATSAVTRVQRTSARSGSLLRGLSDQASLRRLFVLREVIDPPLCLRERHG